jgi:hypothetical protein
VRDKPDVPEGAFGKAAESDADSVVLDAWANIWFQQIKPRLDQLRANVEPISGREWWDVNVEGPVNKALLETLEKNIPQRPGEPRAQYVTRLWQIVDRYRERLGGVNGGRHR